MLGLHLEYTASTSPAASTKYKRLLNKSDVVKTVCIAREDQGILVWFFHGGVIRDDSNI